MTPHEIARTRLTSHSWELHLRLDPALFWFKGHFAAQPLLPGVTQLDWVMRAVGSRSKLPEDHQRQIPGSTAAGK